MTKKIKKKGWTTGQLWLFVIVLTLAVPSFGLSLLVGWFIYSAEGVDRYYCSRCGVKVWEHAKVCSHCGEEFY